MSYVKEIHIIYSKNKCDTPAIYTYNENNKPKFTSLKDLSKKSQSESDTGLNKEFYTGDSLKPSKKITKSDKIKSLKNNYNLIIDLQDLKEIKKEELEVKKNPDLKYVYYQKILSRKPPGVISVSKNQDRTNYIKYIVSLKKEKEYIKNIELKKEELKKKN